MGCGQSKIGNLYQKSKKNKNGSKRNGFSIRSASIEQKNGNGNKTNNNGAEVNRNEEQNGALDKNQAKKKPVVPGGGPLLQQAEISTSQLDFFRMLDEKIENGPDYDESTESPVQAEHVSGLLRRWELASVSWSDVTKLSSSSSAFEHSPQPNRSLAGVQPVQQHQHQHQQPARLSFKSLPPPISGLGSSGGGGSSSAGISSASQPSAKDRQGMRNIVGGRPESAPVYMQRMSSAARVDGLQDVAHHPYHCPSPSMPRHVLESISQSPTQSLKTPPGISSPTAVSRYQQQYHYHHPDLQQNPQQQNVKLTKAQYNGDYSPAIQQPTTAYRDYRQQQQQQPYDSPGPNALLRNSPSNPYLQQFHIGSSSPQSAAQQQPQYGVSVGSRKRAGAGYSTSAQMT